MTTIDQTDDSLSTRVLHAVASYRGVEPSALDFVLYDEVDTDALDALGHQSNTDWRLQIAIDGHTVIVDGDGFLTVDGEEQ